MKSKTLLGAAMLSVGAVAAAPASAAVPDSPVLSTSGHSISVDELGRPSFDGMDIAMLVTSEARILGEQYAGNNCNCNAACRPPHIAQA